MNNRIEEIIRMMIMQECTDEEIRKVIEEYKDEPLY